MQVPDITRTPVKAYLPGAYNIRKNHRLLICLWLNILLWWTRGKVNLITVWLGVLDSLRLLNNRISLTCLLPQILPDPVFSLGKACRPLIYWSLSLLANHQFQKAYRLLICLSLSNFDSVNCLALSFFLYLQKYCRSNFCLSLSLPVTVFASTAGDTFCAFVSCSGLSSRFGWVFFHSTSSS